MKKKPIQSFTLFFQVLTRETTSFSVLSLQELICFCCYGNSLENEQDIRLLNSVLLSCLNEKSISTNRFRFSSSPDFFVPNKTLYKDFIEFIKVSEERESENKSVTRLLLIFTILIPFSAFRRKPITNCMN